MTCAPRFTNVRSFSSKAKRGREEYRFSSARRVDERGACGAGRRHHHATPRRASHDHRRRDGVVDGVGDERFRCGDRRQTVPFDGHPESTVESQQLEELLDYRRQFEGMSDGRH